MACLCSIRHPHPSVLTIKVRFLWADFNFLLLMIIFQSLIYVNTNLPSANFFLFLVPCPCSWYLNQIVNICYYWFINNFEKCRRLIYFTTIEYSCFMTIFKSSLEKWSDWKKCLKLEKNWDIVCWNSRLYCYFFYFVCYVSVNNHSERICVV